MQQDFFEPPNQTSKADLRKAKKLLNHAKQRARHGQKLTPKTRAQEEFLQTIRESNVVLACGSAGVGKTYVSARYALEELLNKNFEKIIITRPMVPVSGESIGFLPGGVKEKTDPWTIPVIDAFKDGASKTTIDSLIKEEKIEFVPFAYIRGRTFADAFILADESQNLTIEQFKVLITRLGENSKIVISGDLRQSDIRGKNGLDYAIRVAETCDVDCEIFEFDNSDVVRSSTVAQWVSAFSEYEK
jgi:phosphate starvation-inducible protein PhoH and related proteins